MASNNETGLNLFKFHINEECSSNIKVEEVDEEIIKTETEVIGESCVPQIVDINELLNENTNLENFAEQFLNKNPALDTIITVNTCRTPTMADENNWSDLNLLTFPIKQECSPANIKVEVDEEVNKAETEVVGGSWVQQNEYFNKLLENKTENRTLDNSAEQLLNGNSGITDLESNSKICERIYNLCTNSRKHNNNEVIDEKVGFNEEEEMLEQDLFENVKTNNKEENEKLIFPEGDNECLSTDALKKQEKDTLLGLIKEKSYKCKECSYAAVRKTSLLTHIKYRHIKEKPYKCNECSYAAALKHHLLSHIKSHHTMEKPYKCNECFYAAVQRTALVRHIKSHHSMEKSYKCTECSFATVGKSNLLFHIKSHHPIAKSYKCNECSYVATRRRYLLSHIKSRHSMEKPYKCNECFYATVRKFALIRHIRSQHSMEKSYKFMESSYAAV